MIITFVVGTGVLDDGMHDPMSRRVLKSSPGLRNAVQLGFRVAQRTSLNPLTPFCLITGGAVFGTSFGGPIGQTSLSSVGRVQGSAHANSSIAFGDSDTGEAGEGWLLSVRHETQGSGWASTGSAGVEPSPFEVPESESSK
ncbi:hypothetical protein ACJ73_02345 [Blastomyces percursus]|uniref:Uncharacterized protein n=1 Tax=Blastomyces percursus TaxID=1658174 RepID=A0A1J9QCL0_9EURO|nr:hypothetical protein ACJ73_02345 [Blastomyces percursus]